MLKYRVLSLIIALALLIAPGGALAAAKYTDIQGRPEESVVTKWSGYGILEGYDGKFDPDGTLTRAQLAVILQRIIRHPTPAENTYYDLYDGAWFTNDALCMVDLGVMAGSGNYFTPEGTLTREMAVSALARAFRIANEPDVSLFSDRADISHWALADVGAMANAGYITPYDDGSFRPKSPMTRAEFLLLLDNVFGGYFYKTGHYPHTKIASNALVNTDNTTFFYTKVNGNFYVTSGVGKGVIFLYSCMIDDTLYISGGGDIRIMDPSELSIPDVTSSTYTSMLVNNLINRVVVDASWDLKLFMSPVCGVGTVDMIVPERTYSYGGKCNELNIEAENIVLNVNNANIVNLNVNKPGLVINSGGVIIQNMTVSYPVKIDGYINTYRTTVKAGGSGSVFSHMPALLTLEPGASVVVNGRTYANIGDEDIIVR